MTGKIHLSLVRKTNLVCQSLVHLAQTEVYTLKKNNKMEKWYEFLRYLNVELKVDVTFISDNHIARNRKKSYAEVVRYDNNLC